MSDTGDYVLGLLGLAAIAVSLGFAGRTARRGLLPGWSGAPALLADAVLAVGLLILISELLGLVGLLDAPLLVAACAIAGVGALRVARADREPRPGALGMREAPLVAPWELAVAIAVALLVAVQWAGPTLLAYDRGMYGGDSLWYHMPFAAHMAQTGSVTELLFTDPLYLNWFYPQVSELLHADGILLFGNDFLSPLINLAWLSVALLAAWCIGRPYGAGAPALTAVAALTAANLLFSRQPGNANNDIVAIALFLAAIAVLVNARRPQSGRLPTGALVVAGLAAGLAIGTKLTAVPPVAALSLGVIVIAPAGVRLRAAGAWLAAVLVGGGLWYVRNLIVSGTPLPFLDLGPLDKPEELAGRDPYSVLHYATDTDVWGRFFRPGLEERLGDLWPLVLLAAVAGVIAWLVRGRRLERMLAAVAALAAIAYLLTPLGASGPEGSPAGFRLNIRYLAPGLALALALAAIPPPLRPDRRRIWRLVALAVFALLLFAGSGVLGEIDSDRIPGSLLLAVAAIGIPAAIVLLVRRGLPTLAVAAGAVVCVLALAIAGRALQDDYLDVRYSSAVSEYPRTEHPGTELSQGLGAAFDWAREVEDSRIGLSGTMGALFQYGLWGLDSSNEVRYIGERGDRGAFFEIEECPDWITHVNAAGFDYVVTTPAYDQDDPGSATAPEQRLWLDAARTPRRAAGAGLVDVWELRGPLDPGACAAARELEPEAAPSG